MLFLCQLALEAHKESWNVEHIYFSSYITSSHQVFNVFYNKEY